MRGLSVEEADALLQGYDRSRHLQEITVSRGEEIAVGIERKRSEHELAHQALHDPLTGLPNRALFLDRLGVALDRSRRTKSPIGDPVPGRRRLQAGQRLAWPCGG